MPADTRPVHRAFSAGGHRYRPRFPATGNDPLGPEDVAANITGGVDDVIGRVGRDANQNQFRRGGGEPDGQGATRAVAKIAGHGVGPNISIAVGRQIDQCHAAGGRTLLGIEVLLPTGKIAIENDDADALPGRAEGVKTIEARLPERIDFRRRFVVADQCQLVVFLRRRSFGLPRAAHSIYGAIEPPRRRDLPRWSRPARPSTPKP